MLRAEQDDSEQKAIKYGELIVLGCNGSYPGGDRGRKRSRFSLCRRPSANGVKPSTVHIAHSPEAAKVISKSIHHSVSYKLSRIETVVVEYIDDNDTDMFQIGRSIESPIDIVVSNTVVGSDVGDTRSYQSTISRFACRIVCERSPPYTARVYAAGFDCSRNIFLGEKASKWPTFDGQMDGLTTNGVLVMHPPHGFSPASKNSPSPKPAVWREVSVCGNIFTLRETRSAQNRGKLMKDESPVLLDGSLIDLCGVTLLWRSVDGLARTPTSVQLEALRHQLNAARPQCPVLLNTLAFPSLDASARWGSAPHPGQPWAYLACGHVHGYHQWRGRGVAFKGSSTEEEEEEQEEEDTQKRVRERVREGERECPLCRSRGPYVALVLGRETAACVDPGAPSRAFVPCGHVCSESTAEYWSSTAVPRGANGFHPVCPFCMKQLAHERPFVRLIFQTPPD
ncbi:E3 ubiquitin-protein ligase pellino homolog 1 [Brachyhypopomus gauderio]|uniref:E3 ubiquitin-protein ligase pellino homolog 1 n=1 Tax=Brachyhypopomus gauderio TaxID=698409 RepID=UPI004042CFAF